MTDCRICDFLNSKGEDARRIIARIPVNDNEYFCVAIPREPATRGHLLIISSKCIKDITHVKVEDYELLKEMIVAATKVSAALKNWDSSIEKVYLLIQGETQHLHIHLKPRRRGEEKGDLFLFDKELEESRWMLKSDNETEESCRRKTLDNGITEVFKGISIIEKHGTLMRSGTWLRSEKEVDEFYDEMIRELSDPVKESLNEHL